MLDDKEKEIQEQSPEGEMDEEEHKLSQEDLEILIRNKDVKAIREIFVNIPDADIADAANNLESRELIYIFRTVEAKYTADFFDALDQDAKENLVRAMTDKELVTVINEQSVDDVADFVDDMPANLAQKVLKAADADMRKDINSLLNYKEDTAGSLMTTEYLEFLDTTLVSEAMKIIRERGKDAETIYTLFIRDKSRIFVGTVDLDDLIFANPDVQLQEIMNRDVVSVNTSTDQEDVARMFSKYDLTAMAVVNNDNRLVGIITVDDAVDVLEEEATEDIAKMNLVTPNEENYLDTKPTSLARKCVPWIMVLLVLGTFSSMVLSQFEETLGKLAVLTAFVPVLMDTGGNSGGQTIALMIRGLAVGEFSPKDACKIFWKEFRAALLTALFVSLFAFAWFTLEQMCGIVVNDRATSIVQSALGTDEAINIWKGNIWRWDFFQAVLLVSFCVAGTLFITVVFSKLVAVALPLLSAALKKDPAIVSQPILTTIIDVSSLLIFFAIAELVIFPLIGV